MIDVNTTAPNFSLPDQAGNIRSLADYANKWRVVYFYPKDDTPGCTTEACNFRDSYHELQKKNIQILGISKDSVESHKKFAEKYNLNFPILSDPDKKVIQEYEAWGKKKFMGKEFEGVLRKTYLLSPDGKVKKIYPKVNPLVHAGEILKDIDVFWGGQIN